MSHFPFLRPRRLRSSAAIRSMVEECHLSPNDFIAPLFIRSGTAERRAISSMPGQFQLSIDEACKEVQTLKSLGVPAVILFGIPDAKDATGSENYNPEGIIPRAIASIKESCPEMLVISDMCFCEYTDHGHCGLINTPHTKQYKQHLSEGYLLNDETLELLTKASVIHAQAGADIIAPSGMLDGMISSLRVGLDEEGFQNTILMSYAAKFASSFYGPFREAAEGAPQFGDRSEYQMAPSNTDEAMREVELDIQEGADIVMVKPALAYFGYHLPGESKLSSARRRLQRKWGIRDDSRSGRKRLARFEKNRIGIFTKHSPRRRENDSNLLCCRCSALASGLNLEKRYSRSRRKPTPACFFGFL